MSHFLGCQLLVVLFSDNISKHPVFHVSLLSLLTNHGECFFFLVMCPLVSCESSDRATVIGHLIQQPGKVKLITSSLQFPLPCPLVSFGERLFVPFVATFSSCPWLASLLCAVVQFEGFFATWLTAWFPTKFGPHGVWTEQENPNDKPDQKKN